MAATSTSTIDRPADAADTSRPQQVGKSLSGFGGTAADRPRLSGVSPCFAGLVFGNLHFITFDGFSYTFSGKGEYQLLSSGELSLQARTERAKLPNGESTVQILPVTSPDELPSRVEDLPPRLWMLDVDNSSHVLRVSEEQTSPPVFNLKDSVIKALWRTPRSCPPWR